MRSMVIGTAGHIDHGKSALIKALTGTDPDRLQEEKSRGITIDLGFAHLALTEDLVAGIVDVPGHERFVKNMVAGTGGIDLVLMVVAADEGVMPQTREHLDICQLLGVRHGLIALTKTDLVEDTDWLEMVAEDIRREFEGTFLEGAPVVPVSARTGAGLDALKATMAELGGSLQLRSADGPAFLAVDRVFTMKGFGTVITGTLTSGRLRLEEAVDLVPDPGQRLTGLKIRGLQNHGAELSEAQAGQRLAINLSGVDRAQLHRGLVLAHQGTVAATSKLEVRLSLLPGAKPLKSRKRMLFHTGTSKTTANIQIVGAKLLEPGGQAYVKVRCEEPLAALPGQHFILRGFSPIPGRGTTIGGGVILSTHPPRRREKEAPTWIAELEALEHGEPIQRLTVVLERAGVAGSDLAGLAIASSLERRPAEKTLAGMLAARQAFKFDRERDRYVAQAVLERLEQQALALLAEFHAENPLLPGMPAEQLRTKLEGPPEPKLFRLLFNELARTERALWEDQVIRLAGHQVRLDRDDSALEQSILDVYTEAALAPPRLAELVERFGRPEGELRDLLRHLDRTGPLTHLTADVFVLTESLEDLRRRLVAHLEQNDSIDTQAFKTMVGQSRKHVIPLAEYFDRQKVTMRVGEKRVLRGRKRT